jgi:hypothetical protein
MRTGLLSVLVMGAVLTSCGTHAARGRGDRYAIVSNDDMSGAAQEVRLLVEGREVSLGAGGLT